MYFSKIEFWITCWQLVVNFWINLSICLYSSLSRCGFCWCYRLWQMCWTLDACLGYQTKKFDKYSSCKRCIKICSGIFLSHDILDSYYKIRFFIKITLISPKTSTTLWPRPLVFLKSKKWSTLVIYRFFVSN